MTRVTLKVGAMLAALGAGKATNNFVSLKFRFKVLGD